jgi:hypothetical protein
MDVEKIAKKCGDDAINEYTSVSMQEMTLHHLRMIFESVARDAIAQDREENTRPGHSPKELIIPGKGRADTLAAKLIELGERCGARKDSQRWRWDKKRRALLCLQTGPALTKPEAAVDAAMEEAEE